jgi:CBS domain-containing protein
MVMLSRLCSFTVVDAQQRHTTLADLAVLGLADDYPPVTHLCFHLHDTPLRVLPWEAVQAIDWRARHLTIADLTQGREIAANLLKHLVLLRQDILDALIIDLQYRRVTRANDLWLEEEGGRLRLRAADTSVRAILRRLSRGRWGQGQKEFLSDWKYMEFLRGDPHAERAGAGYHRRITRLPAGEIAHLTDLLPYLHAAELLTLLPDPLAADTLEVLTPERQLQIFEELAEEQGLHLLDLMAPDLAADLISRLTTHAARRYLNHLSKRQSERIIELLHYPEDTVGGIMTNDILTVPTRMTVWEARRKLRDQLQGPDFVYFLYIVEDEGTRRLRGVMTLRDLLIAEEGRRVEELMNSYLILLHPLDSARDAAYRVLTSHLAALPVVGEEGRILGAVTVDAAVAQVVPQSWRGQAPRVFS